MAVLDWLFPGHLSDTELRARLDKIAQAQIDLRNLIMATQAELAQSLRDLKDQNDKSRAEILAKIADLEAALAAAGGTTPEVDAAFADLKASVQTDDDIVPDPIP